MANLTGQLEGVQDVSRVVEAPAQTSGLSTALNGLAKGFDAVSDVMTKRATAKRQAAVEARAVEDQNWDRENRSRTRSGWAADDYAAGVHNSLNAAAMGPIDNGGTVTDTATAPPPIDSALEGMSPSNELFMTKIGSQVTRTQAGVNQGRMPAIAIEGLANKLFNEGISRGIPAGLIAKSFKDAGIDAFHAYDATVGDSEAADKRRREERTTAYNAGAVALGPAAESKTEDEIVLAGRQKLQDDAVLEAKSKQVAMQTSLNQNSQSDIRFNQEQGDRDAGNLSALSFDNATAAFTKSLLQVTNAAATPERGSDTTFEMKNAKIEALAPQYYAQVKEQVLNKMRASGSSPSAVAQASAAMDDKIKGIMGGIAAGGQAYKNAASIIGTSFGLRVQESAPLVAQMKALGIDYSTMPELMNVLDGPTKARLGSQLKGILADGLVDSAEKTAFKNLVAVATGKANITDIDSTAGRRAIVQQAASYTTANNAKIARGEGDGQTWMAMGRQVAIGAATLTTQNSSADLVKATTVLAGRGTIDAINKLRSGSDTREEAELLGSAKRAAAARLLQASHGKLNATLQNGSDKYQLLYYNEAAGAFQFKFNDRLWGRRTSGAGPVGVGAPSYASGASVNVATKQPPSAEAQQLLAAMNGNLSFLTRTGEWDNDGPKGTNREIAAFWATGKTPESEKAKAGGSSSRRSLYAAQDALIESGSKIPDIDTSVDNADIAGPEGTGQNPRSSAVGVGQFTDSTWLSTLKKHAPELIEGKSSADVLSMRQNKELARKAIGWYRGDNAQYLASRGLPSGRTATALAHFAGPAGAEKLLTADPSAPVESVLGQAAVNANPHLRGKTASQTIEWAKGFYRA
jgi:hypothetical protein